MVVTSLIVILGLATVRQVYQWWREAPVPASVTNEPSGFSPRDVHIAETDWSLSLHSFQGDREALNSRLATLCREALTKAVFPTASADASEAAFTAEGLGDIVDEFDIEAGSNEANSAFHATICRPWFDYPLLVGVLTPRPGPNAESGDTNRRVAAWATAVPLGGGRYTLYTFYRAGRNVANQELPSIDLPSGAQYTLTLS
ncbi:MAG: hypothetical protein D6741_14520, partial [Planctomycetota bacterium]